MAEVMAKSVKAKTTIKVRRSLENPATLAFQCLHTILTVSSFPHIQTNRDTYILTDQWTTSGPL
jgi:hypothetical protein